MLRAGPRREVSAVGRAADADASGIHQPLVRQVVDKSQSNRYTLTDRIDRIATAHTLNDQAETVLMRLAHGSGPDGLAAIAAVVEREHVRVLRPLLDMPRAALALLVDGKFEWSEGPVWDAAKRRLLFSDIPRNMIWEWSEAGGLKQFLQPSGYTGAEPFKGREPGSNGLTFNAAGELVLCQHGDRRVAKLSGGKFVTLAGEYRGKRLNSPNDLVFKSDGDLYFTDPPFGLAKGFDDRDKELPFQGVYRLSRNGALTLLIDDIVAPNGIALSPDERKLYVSDVDYNRSAWRVYDVKEDGTVTNGRLFASANKWRKPPFFGPDGFKVDRRGNLFGARPGGGRTPGRRQRLLDRPVRRAGRVRSATPARLRRPGRGRSGNPDADPER